jgi:hypothetical protein
MDEQFGRLFDGCDIVPADSAIACYPADFKVSARVIAWRESIGKSGELNVRRERNVQILGESAKPFGVTNRS